MITLKMVWNMLFVVVLICLAFVIIDKSAPDVIINFDDSDEVADVMIMCRSPVYNNSDNYWYCNIDDVVKN